MAVLVDGQTKLSAYGSVCTITTPGMTIAQPNSSDSQDAENIDLFADFTLDAYPNPNNGEFTISTSQEGKFNIVNELGQLIQKIELNTENNFRIDIGTNCNSSNSLNPGVYFITGIINENVITKKVIVQ